MGLLESRERDLWNNRVRGESRRCKSGRSEDGEGRFLPCAVACLVAASAIVVVALVTVTAMQQ